ncbi:MAG: FxsA family protein [Gammaproteobacteria bacterium]|nr:FxsA family protein [Gammaproteobacteria bacterium]
MFRLLFLAFLVIPILEIYLLIKVGTVIGALATVFCVVATAVLGAYLLKLQGISTLSRVQGMLAQGQIPAIEMLEGLMLLVAGALLLTPGFFTDALGFLILIPGFRRGVIVWLLKNSQIIRVNTQQTPPRNPDTKQGQKPPSTPNVIEGEYTRDD